MTSIFQWLSDILQKVKLWVIINPWERGVRVRLGKHTFLLEAGWHWKLPFLDEVTIVNTRLRIAPTGFQTLTTKDGKTLTVAILLGFTVVDPLKALLKFQRPESSYTALVLEATSAYITYTTFYNISVSSLEDAVYTKLASCDDGIKVDFAKVVNYAVIKTYRFIQDSWTPATSHPADNLSHPSGITQW